jgi:hypothetical protein
MPSNAETIKNFFVSLGWKIDTAGMSRFASYIALQTEAVRELGEGIKNTAERVVGFVRNIIDTNDNLYFTTQRLQSTATNLKVLKYAAEQTGGEGFVNTLLGQVQSLKEGLETMPGLEALINKQLGVSTRDENGKLRDRVDIFRDIVRQLSQMQGPLKYAMASQLFHIDPTTLDLLTGDKFQKFFDEFKARSKGSADQAVDDANRIETAHRRLENQIDNLKDRALIGLMNAWDNLSPQTRAQIKDLLDLGKQLGRLIYWWDHLSEGERTAIKWTVGITAGVLALAGAIGVAVIALTPIIEGVGVLIGLFTGPVGIIALVVALGAGLYALRNHIPWDALVSGCEAFIAKVKALADVFGSHLKPIVIDVRDLLKDVFTGRWGDAKQKLKDIGNQIKETAKEARAVVTGPTPEKSKPATTSPNARVDRSQPRGIRNNNPGNIEYGDFAREHGASGVEAAGRFAIFRSAQEGLDALGSLLRSYAARGIDTIRSIISRYAPSGENNTESYIATVARRLGFGADAHLNLNNTGVLAGLEQAIVQMENGRNPYSADMYAAAANHAIYGQPAAGRDVQITQNVTTTVTGSSNPQEAAKALTGSLQTANGLLIRNVQPRLQ